MKKIGYVSGSAPEDLSYDFGTLVPEGVEMIAAYSTESIKVMTPETAARAALGLDKAPRISSSVGRTRSSSRSVRSST